MKVSYVSKNDMQPWAKLTKQKRYKTILHLLQVKVVLCTQIRGENYIGSLSKLDAR